MNTPVRLPGPAAPAVSASFSSTATSAVAENGPRRSALMILSRWPSLTTPSSAFSHARTRPGSVSASAASSPRSAAAAAAVANCGRSARWSTAHRSIAAARHTGCWRQGDARGLPAHHRLASQRIIAFAPVQCDRCAAVNCGQRTIGSCWLVPRACSLAPAGTMAHSPVISATREKKRGAVRAGRRDDLDPSALLAEPELGRVSGWRWRGRCRSHGVSATGA